MTWSAPRTWLAGEKPTAATMNLHIRDNQLFIKDGLGGAHINYSQSTAQTLTTAVATKITNLVAVDVGADITYSAGNFTVVKAGVYIGAVTIGYASNTTGYRNLYIYVNGASIGLTQAPAAGNTYVALSKTFRLAASDVVSMYGYQSSGGNLDTLTASAATTLSLTRIGA